MTPIAANRIVSSNQSYRTSSQACLLYVFCDFAARGYPPNQTGFSVEQTQRGRAVFFHFDVLRILEIERFLFDQLDPRNWEAFYGGGASRDPQGPKPWK